MSTQRTISSPCLASRRTRVTGSGSLATSHPVVPLVPRPSSSSTRSTMRVRVSPTTPSRRRAEEPVSSTALWTSTRKPLRQTASPVSTVALSRQLSASSFTAVSTSVFTTRLVRLSHLCLITKVANICLQSRLFSSALLRARSSRRSCSAGVLPLVPALRRILWTPFGACLFAFLLRGQYSFTG